MSGQFQPLNLFSELDIYHLQLPHWRQDGVTYFVTWRLADSLPQSKVRQMKADREQWLHAHGLEKSAQLDSLTEEDRHEYHRLFTARIHQWLDAGMGSCALREVKIARIVEESLRHFDGQRYILDSFVIMPNHVHALLAPIMEWRLEQILHTWKSFTAKAVNRELNRSGTLWLDETWDHIVRSSAQLGHFRNYIQENPAKAMLPEGEFVLGCGTGLHTE